MDWKKIYLEASNQLDIEIFAVEDTFFFYFFFFLLALKL